MHIVKLRYCKVHKVVAKLVPSAASTYSKFTVSKVHKLLAESAAKTIVVNTTIDSCSYQLRHRTLCEVAEYAKLQHVCTKSVNEARRDVVCARASCPAPYHNRLKFGETGIEISVKTPENPKVAVRPTSIRFGVVNSSQHRGTSVSISRLAAE